MSNIKNRPASVTLLFLAVLSISGIFLLRFIFSIKNWEFLKGILIYNPIYLTLTGVFWCSVFLVLAVGIYTKRKWVLIWMKIAGVAFFIFFWVDRLLITNIGYITGRTLFTIISSVILLIIVIFILNRNSVKEFFGDFNE